TEELVEAVQCREKLVQVTQMILTELSGSIALRLQRSRKRASFHRNTNVGSGLAYRRQPCPNRQFAGDEIRPPRRATCFGVIVSESHTLRRELVQVRRLSGHDPLVIGADVEPANVVTHDE